jgi:hypothetical protein
LADLEPLPVECGVDVGQGSPLAAECAGPFVDRRAFRGGLATGLGSGEERVDVGFTSEVSDDSSDGADMELEPLGELVGG